MFAYVNDFPPSSPHHFHARFRAIGKWKVPRLRSEQKPQWEKVLGWTRLDPSDRATRAARTMADEEDPFDEEDSEMEEELNPRRAAKKGKAKRRASAFVEDEAEEEDDDDDDEDVGPSSRRKKRAKQSAFIDDIAAVGDESDEELYDDMEDPFLADELGEVGDREAAADLDMARVHRKLEQERFAGQTEEEMQRYVQERYERQAQEDIDIGGYDAEETEVEKQARLPTIKDPKLWLVRCKRGEEQDLLVRIMQKANVFAERGTPLSICGAAHHANLKGYIYVEARNAQSVKTALKGMQDVFHSRDFEMVSLNEMPDALRAPKGKEVRVRVGSWLKVRGGPYKGDLGKVVFINEETERLKVMLVPRIDFQEWDTRRENDNLDKDSRKRIGKSKVRKQPKPFNKAEAARHNFRVNRRTVDKGVGPVLCVDVTRTLTHQFKDGFILKDASRKAFEIGYKPSYDEIQKFNRNRIRDEAAMGEAEEEEVGVDEQTLKDVEALEHDEEAAGEEDKISFAKGDAIIVTKGDLRNLIGTVQEVKTSGIISINPKHAELSGQTLEVEADKLEKYFTVGSHVKVIRGKFEGSTGMVTDVKGTIASVFSDTTQEDLKVFLSDLVDCAGISHGLTKFGDKYNLLDLVVLDDNANGVIVGVERDSCRVLTNKAAQHGTEVRVCRAQNVQRKIYSGKMFRSDVYDNQIRVGDRIKVLQGIYKDKAGTVKHLANPSHIYVECREVRENLGIICIPEKSCQVIGGEKSAGGGAGFMKKQFPGLVNRSSFNRQPQQCKLEGKRIKVAKGPHGGYIGKVKEAFDEYVTLELEAKHRTVQIKKKHLRREDALMLDGAFSERPLQHVGQIYTPSIASQHGRMGMAMAHQTPAGLMHGMQVPATPFHTMGGAATPFHTMGVPATPGYQGFGGAGAQTPMHAPYGSETPGRAPHTPAHMRSGAFALGGETPYRPATIPEAPAFGAPPMGGPGAMGAPAEERPLRASEVVPFVILSGIVLKFVGMEKYGKVIQTLPISKRVTLLLGTYARGQGFTPDPSNATEEVEGSDLELAAPPANAIVRILEGEHKQGVQDQGQVIDYEEGGEAMVRAGGQMGDVHMTRSRNVGYLHIA